MTLTYGKDLSLSRKDRQTKVYRKSLRHASRRESRKADTALNRASPANVMLYSSDNEQEPASPLIHKQNSASPRQSMMDKVEPAKQLGTT